MKSCLRIPRIFLPGHGFQKFAVPPCGEYPQDKTYWENLARKIGDAPSALSCILPDAYLGEDDEKRLNDLHEAMYSHLESGVLTRIERGFVFTERHTSFGIRGGIVAAFDLEAYSGTGDKTAAVRGTTELLPELVQARLNVRKNAVLEFPHTVLLYRDKKDRIVRELRSEALDQLYEFETSGGDGLLEGYFITRFYAEDIARELVSRADPCFAVADGNHSLAAAKMRWDAVKTKLSETEKRNHPLRFTLAEFVNACDDAVEFLPMFRALEGIDGDAFADFLSRTVKCRREGKILYLPDFTASVRAADKAIGAFLRESGGKLSYLYGGNGKAAEKYDCVVGFPRLEKEELFSMVKAGKLLPAKTFSLGYPSDKRYCLESREISYD